MSVDNSLLYFTYEGSKPTTVTYNGTKYYYVTNLQGDVVAILDGSGNLVVEYRYDAWGNIMYMGGSMVSTLGGDNPLRYRGYVCDHELGLYYLQSRYYNPAIGRFLNADSYASTGQGILGHNMFAYCNNSPVSYSDSSGKRMVCVGADLSGGSFDYVIYYFHPESKKNLDKNAKQNHSSADSRFTAVSSFEELTAAINNTPTYIDDVYIYLHGDARNLSFYYDLNYSAADIQDGITEIDIYGDIYLFSCKGGRGNLASTLADSTNCTVIASVYKVSFGNGFARCGWENYFRDVWKHDAYSWYSFYPDGNNSPASYFWILTQ